MAIDVDHSRTFDKRTTATVRDVTYDLLRAYGLTTIFGNLGSTEEPFLADFPSDFRYVLGLQEASVIAMADGFAQATRGPALVNLHTGAGLGNAMGNLGTAFQNKTPLIVTAGQQTREMLLLEPYLTNTEPTMLPRPWVKWAYQPARAQDVPAAFMRAIATALQPPAGPVFLSLPLDDWDKPSEGPAVVRTVATRVAPDPARLDEFADALRHASSPVMIYGAAIARGNGWSEATALAEALNAPVWAAPASERTPFPEDHPLYRGELPFAMGPLSEKLEKHDLALVVGAPVFRYYPYIPGPYVPSGMRLLHISDDPGETGRAPIGDSLLGDAVLSLAALTDLLPGRPPSNGKAPARVEPAAPNTNGSGDRLSAADVFAALSEIRPARAVLVEEAPSNHAELHAAWPITEPDTFLHVRQRRTGVGPPRVGGDRVCRARNRPQPAGRRHHRRRVLPVLGPVDLERGTASAADPDRDHAQPAVHDPRVVRRAGADARRPGPRSPRHGLRVDRAGIRLRRRPHRGSRRAEAVRRERLEQRRPDRARGVRLRRGPAAGLTVIAAIS
jgi:benzoylformate decarboxylase